MVYNNPVSYGVDITPEMFVDLADEPKLVAIKESSENVRRITDLRNACGDRYIAVLRCRRPRAGEPPPGRDGLGLGPGQRLPGREPAAVGPGRGGSLGRGARGLSLVHAAAPPGHAREARAVHQARPAGVRARLRDGPGAPRCRSMGEERERILAIIRRSIATPAEVAGAAKG